MRSTVADANETVRRMQEVVASTQKDMWVKARHIFDPKLQEVERKAAALRSQLAAEKLVRAGYEVRALKAEEDCRELQDKLELEADAYRTSANEARDGKKQKREWIAEWRKATGEHEAKLAAAASEWKVAVAAARREGFEAAQQQAADAAAAADVLQQKLRAQLEAQLADAQSAADNAVEVMETKLRKGPRYYSEEALDELSTVAERQQRCRERKFFKWLVSGRSWRMENVVGVMKDMGWLEEIHATREGQQFFMDLVRELGGVLEGVHYGINYGLWMHLTKKMPGRLIREMRQAGA